eukprot:COSAG02_NODE_38074_length_433_cov_4.497006_1_plen_58_part_10
MKEYFQWLFVPGSSIALNRQAPLSWGSYFHSRIFLHRYCTARLSTAGNGLPKRSPRSE